jgi:hypothetical protein
MPEGPERLSPRIVPPWACTMAREIARPRPTPGVALSFLPRSNLSNRASSRPGGKPGPWSSTTIDTDEDEAVALTSIALPRGVYLAAFSSRLTSTRSNSTASRCSSGSPSASNTLTGLPCKAGPQAASALPTTSSSGCHSRRIGTAPASSRAMSSRLPTIAFIRSADSRMAAVTSSRAAGSGGVVIDSVSARPTSAASGVRKSCEIADSSELRRRSDSICTVLFCATSMQWMRSSEIARSEAQVSSSRRWSGPRVALGRLHSQHTAKAHRRLQRQHQAGAGREGVGAETRGLAAVEGPLGHRVIDRGGAAGQGQQPVALVGSQQGRAGVELRRQEARAELGHLIGHQGRGQVARHLVQAAHAVLALRGGFGLHLQHGGELADRQGNHTHHDEGDEVLHIADREGQAWANPSRNGLLTLPMKLIATELPGVVLVETPVFADDRGWFLESFSQPRFDAGLRELGLPPARPFVQDKHSCSARGVLRGLHYQLPPHPQGKLVRVTHGAAFDVAVDIRRGSPTFGRWFGAELSAGA